MVAATTEAAVTVAERAAVTVAERAAVTVAERAAVTVAVAERAPPPAVTNGRSAFPWRARTVWSFAQSEG